MDIGRQLSQKGLRPAERERCARGDLHGARGRLDQHGVDRRSRLAQLAAVEAPAHDDPKIGELESEEAVVGHAEDADRVAGCDPLLEEQRRVANVLVAGVIVLRGKVHARRRPCLVGGPPALAPRRPIGGQSAESHRCVAVARALMRIRGVLDLRRWTIEEVGVAMRDTEADRVPQLDDALIRRRAPICLFVEDRYALDARCGADDDLRDAPVVDARTVHAQRRGRVANLDSDIHRRDRRARDGFADDDNVRSTLCDAHVRRVLDAARGRVGIVEDRCGPNGDLDVREPQATLRSDLERPLHDGHGDLVAEWIEERYIEGGKGGRVDEHGTDHKRLGAARIVAARRPGASRIAAVSEPGPGPRKRPRGWRMPGAFGEVLVARSVDVPLDQRDSRELIGHGMVDEWLADRWARETALEIVQEVSGLALRDGWGVAPGSFDASARLVLERALRSGELVVLRLREPAWVPLSRPLENERPLAPQHAQGIEEDWIDVLLVDASGRAVPGEHFTVRLSSGNTIEDRSLDSRGIARLDGLEPQAASACTVSFERFSDRSDALPPRALPAAPPKLDELGLRTPIDGPLRVAWREMGSPLPASLHATNVYQLTRQRAVAIEIEHFSPGAAVVLPGPSPAKLREGADTVQGIDALRAVLQRAAHERVESVVIVGHGPKISSERVISVQHVLAGERRAWAAHAMGHAGSDDAAHVLRWAAHTYSWPCDPNLSPDPRGGFKDSYNAAIQGEHRGEGLRPLTSSALNVPMWEAFFDVYQWALRPSSRRRLGRPYLIVNNRTQTYPVLLAKIGALDERRYRDLYPLNPGREKPGDMGWNEPRVSDVIYLPTHEPWKLDRLRERGYDVFDGEPLPEDSKDPPLLDPARLRTVGCGDAHVRHPHDGSLERRAVDRHVEVFLLPWHPAPRIASASESCTTRTCELYDPRVYDFEYVRIRPLRARTLEYGIHLPEHDWITGGRFQVVSADGSQRVEIPIAEGRRKGDYRVFYVRGVRDGVLYDGTLELRDASISLFSKADLSKLLAPEDPFTVLASDEAPLWRFA